MIAVRREDAARWPCPWVIPDDVGMSSAPTRWTLASARVYVDLHRTDEKPWAVYQVSGARHRRIYPRTAT